MRVLSWHDSFALLCKATKKWGLYINWDHIDDPVPFRHRINDHSPKSPANYLNYQEHADIIGDQRGILLFNSEAEMLKYFKRTVGDDGPSKLNRYKGPHKIYAMTCSPKGLLLTTNT